ncbi:MAG: VCBS repeat-containing protein, partial [Planctomycetota bacterium]|nr:VCBS repeat-containing protein [Planctomycetota bacterium]
MNAPCSALVLVACATVALAQGEIAFERHELSDVFFCEGASFADLDRDGHGDVIAGPYWYAGPDFEERHEIYAPKPFDPLGYSDNFFAWPRDFDGDDWIDVLFVGFPGREAAWYENPGPDPEAGGAWERHLVFPVVDNEAPAFADLTGDGREELVFHTGGRFGFAEPDADDPSKPWSFTPISEDRGLPKFVHGLGVGDLNGDGRADLLEKDGWWEQPASWDRTTPWT